MRGSVWLNGTHFAWEAVELPALVAWPRDDRGQLEPRPTKAEWYSMLCLYLRKPEAERRGLDPTEARIVETADRVPLPFDLKSACDKPHTVDEELPSRYERIDKPNYYFQASYAGMRDDLAPLDRIQHDFADRWFSHVFSVAESRPPGETGKEGVDLEFGIKRSGKFAYLSVGGTHSDSARKDRIAIRSGWLFHVPTRQVVGFDDLFVDPMKMRRALSFSLRTPMETRLKNIYVGGATVAERRAQKKLIDETIVAATDPGSRHDWGVGIDRIDCTTMLHIGFDTKTIAPNIPEAPEWSVPIESIRKWLKPEYRHAWGE